MPISLGVSYYCRALVLDLSAAEQRSDFKDQGTLLNLDFNPLPPCDAVLKQKHLF